MLALHPPFTLLHCSYLKSKLKAQEPEVILEVPISLADLKKRKHFLARYEG